MAQMIITIPDAQMDRVTDALAERAGLLPQLMTSVDVKAVVVDFIKQTVWKHERKQAMDAITNNALDVS